MSERQLRAAAYASEKDAGPLHERKGLQRLLKQASNKEFEAVVVDDIRRFGTAEEITTVYNQLRSHGIKVFDQIGEVTEDDISKLD